MTVRVILCCAGRVPDPKWNNHLGAPKHLAPTPDGPLLHRTIGQVTPHTAEIVVTAPPGDHRYQVAGATTVHPDPARNLNEYSGSRPWWNDRGRTVLMLGDVYFTAEAIATIFAATEQAPYWFGRYGASKVTASRWGEIFAVSWWPSHHGRLDRHLRRVAASPHVRRPPGWKLYRSMHGLPLRHHTLAGDWVEINDATDDFDVPATYQRHPAIRS